MEFEFNSYGYIATHDFNDAVDLVEIKPHIAMLYFEQAIEKAYKQFLLEYGIDSDDKVFKSHSLKKLFEKVHIEELSEYEYPLTDLSDVYFETRYPNEYYRVPTVDEAKDTMKLCQTSFEIILKSIDTVRKKNYEDVNSYDEEICDVPVNNEIEK